MGETSLQEVAFHLTRALQAAGGDFDNETRYIELLADFEADFVDLRKEKPTFDCLHPDPAIGYPAGQELADQVRLRDITESSIHRCAAKTAYDGCVLAGADSEFPAGRDVDLEVGWKPDADDHKSCHFRLRHLARVPVLRAG